MLFDFHMSDAEFDLYRKLIYDICGINFTYKKKQLLMTRLRKRMTALEMTSFRAYREHIINPKHEDEFALMINSISTNTTNFFREPEAFRFLNNRFYPKLAKQEKIRIWSAACSSGEEAYTLAMTCLEFFDQNKQIDIKILATDISTAVLQEAQMGIYSDEQIKPIVPHMLRKYFYKGYNRWKNCYLVKDEVKELIRFRHLNLNKSFPLQSSFDFIFCRNVMIYFDKPTRTDLVSRLSKQIVGGGYLMIGNAESLSGISSDLQYVQPSIYQK